jgi:membrane-bound lytic murein transglycosylase D
MTAKSKWSLISFVALCSTLAGLRLALGWSEPHIFAEQEKSLAAATDENGKTESVVNQGEEAATETEEVPTDKVEIKKDRPWQAPNFSGQEGALGWSPDTFKVPKALEARVNFWKDVYSKYTTQQGVLHDSRLVTVVYEKLDLDPKMGRRERKRFLESHKTEIRNRLLHLDQLDTEFQKTHVAPKLEGEDLRVWNMFAEIDEPHRFKKATERKRIRFQLGQRDRFLLGLYYSGRYLPEMERVFKEAGLPRELTRLPFVESSFNVKARSRVGASGIWQFMRYTGRKFMRIHYASDERNDPIHAATAAARLFRLNFEMLGKWPLAITGYNHGAVGVQRMVRQYETDDITDLVDERRGRFGFASANFFACFLAALEIEKEAPKYFGSVFWDQPLDGKEIRLTRSLNKKMLIKWFGDDVEKAKDLNPHLSRVFWSGYAQLGAKDFVRVPVAQYEVAVKDLESPTKVAHETSKSTEVAKADAPAGVQYYVIAPGETLGQIARELGVSIMALSEVNAIDDPKKLRPGQKLIVPASKVKN